MQKNSLVIILFSVCCSISFGQDIRLVASSSEKGVELKWFYKELIAPEGVNLYEQKNDGQWNKLNQKPIKKGDYSISNQELSQDKELKKHVDLVSSTKKLEGFGLLLATIKSIKSSSYARFLGMYYFVEISDTTSDYRYKVALIKEGKEFQFSEITIKEFKSNKSKVEDITFDQKLKKVNFTWTHSENKFFAYNIYRSTSKDSIGELITKDPVILSKVKNEKGIEEYPKSFFEDRFVKEKNTYYYRVVGIDFFFHEQEMSEPITVRIKDQTAPSAPKIISKKEIKEGFKISWELDHVEEDVNGIVLFLSERNDTLLKRVENVKINKVDREFEIKFPIIGTYLVKIATEDEDGNLGFSNEYVLEYLDKIPPARPDNVSIQIDSTFLKISWNENNETDLLGYKVYRGINGDLQSMSLQNAAPIKKAEFVDQLPKNAKNNFTYYIIAVDTVLNESERSTFVSEKLLDVVPPKAPFIKSVDVTKEGAQLVWVKNTERDLYKYEVHRKKISDSTATFEKINLSFLDRSSDGFLDRTIIEGQIYSYIIFAFDSLENKSLASNVFKVQKPLVKEKATFNCYFKKIKYTKATNSVKLIWDIKPFQENVRYVVFRFENERGFVPLNSVSQINRYTDYKVESGKTYTYEIRCYLEDGQIVKSEKYTIEIKNNQRK